MLLWYPQPPNSNLICNLRASFAGQIAIIISGPEPRVLLQLLITASTSYFNTFGNGYIAGFIIA